MIFQKAIKAAILLIFLVIAAGCDDSLFPSIGNYKINIQINNLLLDECSFARSIDSVRPSFEVSVADDPDVTGLVVFLRDFNGAIAGWRVLYELNPDAEEIENNEVNLPEADEETESEETENNKETVTERAAAVQFNDGDDLVIQVKSLDNLPVFPIPDNLPMDRYTIVSHVMSGKDILQKIEKPFFYLGNTEFSYEGIDIHLPGIADSTQLIPRGTVIMLEANLKFDSMLDPFIVWYNGRTKISEGNFSEDAGYLLWKTPEESGFYSLRAVIYPINNYQDLSGYQKEISVLVSSKLIDIHLVSENTPSLVNWYIFEGNLNDSKNNSAEERSLVHENNSPRWRSFNGTYGVATGFLNYLTLPKAQAAYEENWQMLFRFKPENDGGLLSIQFGKSVFMYLFMDGPNLALTLTSPFSTVSQNYPMLTEPKPDDVTEEIDSVLEETIRTWVDENSFLTASINFSIQQGSLTARLNVLGNYIDSKLADTPVVLKTQIENDFLVTLGFQPDNKKPVDHQEETSDQPVVLRSKFTALWDEFALYCLSRTTDITEES